MKKRPMTAMVVAGPTRRWETWTVSDTTGARLSPLITDTSKSEAKRYARDWNRRNEGFGGSQA